MSAATAHHPPLVGFIGAGNIARALAGGLINSGWDRSRLILSDPDATQRDGVAQLLGLEVHVDNAAVATVTSGGLVTGIAHGSTEVRQ